MDPLGNPIWHALSGPQLNVAQGGPLARRFDPELSAFTALPDDPTREAWDALSELVGPGNLALLFQPFTELPPGWREEFSGLGVQMVWNGDRRALEPMRPVAPGAPAAKVEVLGPDDVADMLDLVSRTEPGPFLPRTHELGTYVGARDPDDGRLLALAGQRLRPPGHVEISAVCTDPEARGRGLARLLVAWLIDEIASSGDIPILHVAAHNTGAARLYRAMGFEATLEMRYGAFAAPGGPADRTSEPATDQATG
jgi:GNAT superfamily N-acetyltransferase